MIYDSFKYLYPPRPEIAVAPTALRHIEAQGWWGQAKMNGTCTTLYVSPERDTIARGRHGESNVIKLWEPGARWDNYTRTFHGKGWYVFVAELLHVKGSAHEGVDDTLYLFDLLVDDGKYLVGTTYGDRYHRLRDLCKSETMTHTHRVVMPGVWLAENHRHHLIDWFNAAAPNYIEGLVFKNPNTKLRLCSTPSSNNNGQAKCRRAKKNLSF